jgi:hypothetical protein
MEWITNGLLLGLIVILLNIALMGLAAVLLGFMPADYFTAPHSQQPLYLTLIRNLPGMLIVLLGIVMLALPGPGILMIVAGLVLIRSPRKTRLLKGLVVRPSVFRFIQRMRQRFDTPMLEFTPGMQQVLASALEKEQDER